MTTFDQAITATAPTDKPRKALRRRVARPSAVDPCDRCGHERSVRWRGRSWCVDCDSAEVFGEANSIKPSASPVKLTAPRHLPRVNLPLWRATR